jgi:hypothetical protein
LQKGIPWPTPRFTDNNNGTVIDNLTGLIWMKNANAFSPRTWAQAISDANNLKSGDAGLTDGSKAGDWRLPNIRELHSLVDYSQSSGMALPAGHPFTEVHWDGPYWSSTTDEDPLAANSAWNIGFDLGGTGSQPKGNPSWVWCVRGGG